MCMWVVASITQTRNYWAKETNTRRTKADLLFEAVAASKTRVTITLKTEEFKGGGYRIPVWIPRSPPKGLGKDILDEIQIALDEKP